MLKSFYSPPTILRWWLHPFSRLQDDDRKSVAFWLKPSLLKRERWGQKTTGYCRHIILPHKHPLWISLWIFYTLKKKKKNEHMTSWTKVIQMLSITDHPDSLLTAVRHPMHSWDSISNVLSLKMCKSREDGKFSFPSQMRFHQLILKWIIDK